MSDLTEMECLSKHKEALGEAHRACQHLGRNAGEGVLKPRGHDFHMLKTALKELEGSARQVAHYRADARWLRLGILYARVAMKCQVWFVGQRWKNFHDLMPLFINGQGQLEQLQGKTGTLGPILPQRASDWLWMPPYASPRPDKVRAN